MEAFGSFTFVGLPFPVPGHIELSVPYLSSEPFTWS